MSFLSPLFWVLGLLGLPVIALYLTRERPKQKTVSTLLFWVGSASRVSESARWLRVRRWVSLLLQLAFLLFLVAALARPVFSRSPARPVIIVLDTSASMQASDVQPDRLAAAKRAALVLVDRLAGGREAAVLTTSPALLVGWSDSRRELREAVLRARTATETHAPDHALQFAKNLALARHAEIYFFSDGVWDGHPSGVSLDGITLRLIEGAASNAGLTRLAARRSENSGEIRVLVEAGWSKSPTLPPIPLPRRLTLEQDGMLVDERDVSPPASGLRRSWLREWTVRSENTTRISARLGVPATDAGAVGAAVTTDAVVADNEGQLEVPAMERTPVVLVSDPDPFLEAALSSIPDLEFIRISPQDPLRFGDAKKLWIFQGALPPPDFQAAGLILIDPPGDGFFGRRIGPMEAPWITTQNRERGPARLADLTREPITEATEFQPLPEAEVFASSAGRPMIFGQWEPGGDRLLWLVLAWRPSRTGLVTQAAFPLLVSGFTQGLRLRPDSSAPVLARGLSPALTALEPQVSASQQSGPISKNAPVFSAWQWLVAAGVLWVFIEWWAWHRRLTE